MGNSRKRGWQQWTSEDARRELAAWRASRQPLAAFARERGYSTQRLRWWRDRLAQWNGQTAALAPVLVPAAIATPPTTASGLVTLQMPGGVFVEVEDPAKVPAQWLAALARELLR